MKTVKHERNWPPRTAILLNGEVLYGVPGRYCLELAQMQATWIRVTSIGSENLYFEFRDDAGEVQSGYCKCL